MDIVHNIQTIVLHLCFPFHLFYIFICCFFCHSIHAIYLCVNVVVLNNLHGSLLHWKQQNIFMGWIQRNADPHFDIRSILFSYKEEIRVSHFHLDSAHNENEYVRLRSIWLRDGLLGTVISRVLSPTKDFVTL